MELRKSKREGNIIKVNSPIHILYKKIVTN